MKQNVIATLLTLGLTLSILSLNSTASSSVFVETDRHLKSSSSEGDRLETTANTQISLTERSATNPTQFWWLHGVSVAQIRDKINEGYRIIDLEVEQTSPYRLSTAMVKNEGVYEKTWWWYYGLTSQAVKDKLSQHEARIIDLQVYRVDGQKRYAIVLVKNTGSEAKEWWYYSDLSFDEIMARAKNNEARIIDIDSYVVGRNRLFSAVMIRNTGTDRKAWWVYSNKSPEFIRSKLNENNARLIDIEWRGNNSYIVVMEPSENRGWWWYHGVSASRINELWRQHGARIFDIEPYTVNGDKRFAVLMLSN